MVVRITSGYHSHYDFRFWELGSRWRARDSTNLLSPQITSDHHLWFIGLVYCKEKLWKNTVEPCWTHYFQGTISKSAVSGEEFSRKTSQWLMLHDVPIQAFWSPTTFNPQHFALRFSVGSEAGDGRTGSVHRTFLRRWKGKKCRAIPERPWVVEELRSQGWPWKIHHFKVKTFKTMGFFKWGHGIWVKYWFILVNTLRKFDVRVCYGGPVPLEVSTYLGKSSNYMTFFSMVFWESHVWVPEGICFRPCMILPALYPMQRTVILLSSSWSASNQSRFLWWFPTQDMIFCVFFCTSSRY